MSQILENQAWEDVADDVTGAIEKAVQPLLKKAVDEIYGGLLDATQDYLKDNVAFNIASRISVAEREAADARQSNAELLEALQAILSAPTRSVHDGYDQRGNYLYVDAVQLDDEAFDKARAAIAKAEGR